ncbi:hypothetical protein ACN9JZ_03560 [Aliarcobacter butzleri]|uniref:hypothetical protein n=1 Tax=Aliarcobacter butzleri TaxID=28197 RepID=UPI003AF98F63
MKTFNDNGKIYNVDTGEEVSRFDITSIIGNFTYHSDGTNSNQIGNMSYHSDGTFTMEIGNSFITDGKTVFKR